MDQGFSSEARGVLGKWSESNGGTVFAHWRDDLYERKHPFSGFYWYFASLGAKVGVNIGFRINERSEIENISITFTKQ
jgi:hypothetical protein